MNNSTQTLPALTERVDLANFLKALAETVETGFLTPLRLTENILESEGVDLSEQVLLEQEVELVLTALCSRRTVLALHSHREGVCPECQQCHIFPPGAYQEAMRERHGTIACIYGCQPSLASRWRWHSAFCLMDLADLVDESQEGKELANRPGEEPSLIKQDLATSGQHERPKEHSPLDEAKTIRNWLLFLLYNSELASWEDCDRVSDDIIRTLRPDLSSWLSAGSTEEEQKQKSGEEPKEE